MQSQKLQLQPIPETTVQNQPPPAYQQQEPQSQPEPTDQEARQNNDFDADLYGNLLGDRKLSADTIVGDDGIPNVQIDTTVAANDNPPMDESEAMKHTRTLMDMRETAQSLGLSYIADGSVEYYAKYKYEPWQKNLLIEAWAPLVQSMGLRVNPWIKVLYAEGISTTPLVMLSLNNRKQRIKIQEQAAVIADLQRQNSELRTAPVMQDLRADTKNQWKVDTDGFFEYTKAGTYIKIKDRKEKPELTPEGYELLCKHNGKDFIDKTFDIK